MKVKMKPLKEIYQEYMKFSGRGTKDAGTGCISPILRSSMAIRYVADCIEAGYELFGIDVFHLYKDGFIQPNLRLDVYEEDFDKEKDFFGQVGKMMLSHANENIGFEISFEDAPSKQRIQSNKMWFLAKNSGEDVLQDKEEAVKCYKLAAQQGDALAQNILGFLYEAGEGVLQDKEEAVTWYRRAAKQGYVLAQYNLGVLYDTGKSVPQDKKEAFKWYRRAVEQGDALAQHNLNCLLEKTLFGEQFDEQSKDISRKYIQFSIRDAGTGYISPVLRSLMAIRYVADCIEAGHKLVGISGFHLFEDGTIQPNQGLDVHVENFDKEKDFFGQLGKVILSHVNENVVFKISFEDSPSKQRVRSRKMQFPAKSSRENIREDKKEAAKWYRRTARQGYILLFPIFFLLEKAYRSDAEFGFSGSRFNLGFMYGTGEGVRQDYKEAFKWWKLAAKDGHADAQHNLNWLLEKILFDEQ